MRPTRISFAFVLLTACLALTACDEDGAETFDGDPNVPPDDPGDIEAWTEMHGYRGWAQNPEPHESMGTGHPGQVRVYLSPELDASLAAGNMHHPQGSMAVKEIYDDGGKVAGITVSLKMEATSGDNPDPNAWYWWERSGTNVIADGEGESECVSCHSAAFVDGKDYVLTAYPLP